ncbi:MAG: PHB depolymerase family esterase [Planctomycetota bacterium]|jgi:polyhydroxybutyrate depolymerase
MQIRTVAASLLLAACPAVAQDPGTAPPIPEELRELVDGMRLPIKGPVASTAGPTVDAGRGPVPIHVPPSYDPDTPIPLVFLLHGYTNSGPEVEAWFQLTPLANEFGFLLLYPTGTSDILGPFWNATDACCGFGSPDDSGYLRDLIEAVQAEYNVDPRRIHFAGHSNGGFMSYRMACDHADLVASIASLAGATFQNTALCTPSEPVHVLQIHGTNDGVIDYNGGCIPLGGCYPSAPVTTTTWATYNACSLTPDTSAPPIDIDAAIAGAETTITRYESGCDAGGSAELWTIPGGPHSPPFAVDATRKIVEFLFAHPKPALCPADLDGSGDVGFGDILAIIAAWGPCGAPCPEDLSGNGSVDFADILAVIAAFGDC